MLLLFLLFESMVSLISFIPGSFYFCLTSSTSAHHIDVYSILHPATPTPVSASGLILRQVDSATANREEVVCPVCGEGYGTHDRW